MGKSYYIWGNNRISHEKLIFMRGNELTYKLV